MASTDLNQKFTLEKYCSRLEVAKSLGTNLIEPFWREISEFRKKFSIELPLFDTSYNKFSLTFIDSVQGKTAQLNDRVSSFASGASKLTAGSIARYTFTREMLKTSLKALAKFNKIDISEITLANIVENKTVDEQYRVLVRYFNALQNIKHNSFDDINDEFLAKNYAILRGEEELTSFYREEDNTSASSRFLVDRDYDQGIPSHLIDDFMNSLLDYINNLDISLVTRISSIFFMFNYIKPFESYNMELACLLAKRVLSSTSIDAASIYVPLESFLNDSDFFESISKEVKRTRDFTYAFLKASEILNESFDVAISRINEVHAYTLDSEVKLGTDEKKIKEEFGIKVEKPVIKVERVETKNQIQKRIESRVIEPENPLSEKELKEKMNDLLERDPFLKKGQAHFYVHHCTVGKYYSIQQYIKFEKCVYETGRTSMDNLAKLGYYRREQIKNKFVYTPINKE